MYYSWALEQQILTEQSTSIIHFHLQHFSAIAEKIASCHKCYHRKAILRYNRLTQKLFTPSFLKCLVPSKVFISDSPLTLATRTHAVVLAHCSHQISKIWCPHVVLISVLWYWTAYCIPSLYIMCPILFKIEFSCIASIICHV